MQRRAAVQTAGPGGPPAGRRLPSPPCPAALMLCPCRLPSAVCGTLLWQMAWLGHSQGNTLAYMALADDPGLAESVTVLVALAPCAYVKYMTSSVLTAFMAQANVRKRGRAGPVLPEWCVRRDGRRLVGQAPRFPVRACACSLKRLALGAACMQTWGCVHANVGPLLGMAMCRPISSRATETDICPSTCRRRTTAPSPQHEPQQPRPSSTLTPGPPPRPLGCDCTDVDLHQPPAAPRILLYERGNAGDPVGRHVPDAAFDAGLVRHCPWSVCTCRSAASACMH